MPRPPDEDEPKVPVWLEGPALLVEGILGAEALAIIVLAFLGILAITVVIPILLACAGALLAAHVWRTHAVRRPPPALGAVILTPIVLVAGLGLSLMVGWLSWSAIRNHHPILMGVAVASAVVSLVGLGWYRMQSAMDRV